ncbi:hypothetical protein [Maribacter sp. Asnod1-A12]|uniref:hypothetical protein n=1 Tax=Maribacter sp. Asnod1-A12 TaxID=3160576 RepID=UPI00386393EE
MTNRTISVEIDSLLLPHLDTADKVSTNRIIRFNLYRLIYHIGTVQSRRWAPSNRNKFQDKSDLIEKIYNGTEEFRIKTNQIRIENGSEVLTTISEDFGVGISVLIAEQLFNLNFSTIQRIYGGGRRPDWKCQTKDDRILVVECKGSTNINTSNQQQVNALQQKMMVVGDIRVASLTLLNEDEISSNRFLDPPIENNDNSPIMENHILRAGHYASVFSFLGNSKLSRYYSQMRKRLQGLITPIEQEIKDSTFRDLYSNKPRVSYKNKEFAGSFYKVENDNFLFVGVDKRLLSYRGFLTFEEYQTELDETQNENHYLLFQDGVLIIEIKNISYFSDVIEVSRIQNIQDKITISDIDAMTEISFRKYFVFILEKNGFENFQEERLDNNLRIDLSAYLQGVQYFFEFKLSRNKKLSRNVIEQLSVYQNRLPNRKFYLVTNSDLDKVNFSLSDYNVIGRNELKQIAQKPNYIMELIDTTPNNV